MKKVLVLFAALVLLSSASFAEKMKMDGSGEMKCENCAMMKMKSGASSEMKCDDCAKMKAKSDASGAMKCENCAMMKMNNNGMGHGCDIRNFKKFQNDLGLTDAQVKSIDSLSEAQKEKMMSIKEKIYQLKEEKNTALANKNYDAAKAAVREMAVLKGDMQAYSIDYKKDVAAILTEEQSKKFADLSAKAVEEKKEIMKDKKCKSEKKDKKTKKQKKKSM